MPACRHILTSLCLSLPALGSLLAFGLLPALPVMAQNVQTGIDAATQAVPQTAQITEQSTDTPPPAASPLWVNPADLNQSQTAAISLARAGETDILSCPFETLRAAYLSLYDDTDALNVAALTSEVFKVCIERQKQVKLLLDNEERLRAQIGDLSAAARRATSDATSQIIAPASQVDIAEEESTGDVITQTLEPTIPAPRPPVPPETFREAKSAELALSTLLQCSDRYTSGPIFGATTLEGGLHALIYDATRGTELSVKPGDVLPGKLTITGITTETGVIVSEQGVERPLARALAEPAFDDGGGLLFKTVSFADVYKPNDAEDASQDSDWEALK